ncbi:twin-arginine translocase TatA/TatE family subunit [Dactylosporangium sp. NPDC000555]|uniref:twin-arginine translocase TatA/TatE family subunit n=1 Tax=Dactylosporangium sp. NPDC000555 TaxID=3154260 RepID=UPI00331FECF8
MGLENLGGWHLVVIVLVGLFVFGPDRLPKAISDGLRMLRTVRQMARDATGDLGRELGTDLRLEDLHPKTFVRKHLLSEADEAALRKPLQDLYDDVRETAQHVHRDARTAVAAANTGARETAGPAAPPAARPSWDDVT